MTARVSKGPDEITLLRQAADGSVDAFLRLVCKYDGPILNLAVRVAGSWEGAHDIYRRVFLELYRNLPSIKPSALRKWIYRLARTGVPSTPAASASVLRGARLRDRASGPGDADNRPAKAWFLSCITTGWTSMRSAEYWTSPPGQPAPPSRVPSVGSAALSSPHQMGSDAQNPRNRSGRPRRHPRPNA
jgi:hypothetical protein